MLNSTKSKFKISVDEKKMSKVKRKYKQQTERRKILIQNLLLLFGMCKEIPFLQVKTINTLSPLNKSKQTHEQLFNNYDEYRLCNQQNGKLRSYLNLSPSATTLQEKAIPRSRSEGQTE